MDVIKHKLIRIALASRAFIWALAIIADSFVPNHNAGVFTWTLASSVKGPTIGDRIIAWITDGLTTWDGQYFIHIANHGYTYENTLAFFPGYPFLVKIMGEVLHWLQVDYGLIQFHTALKLAGVTVNLGLFVIATLALYELSWKLFKDEYLAYKSALFFCINPASIFFSATYSESLHAALSFLLMAKLEKGFSFKVGLLLILASFCRSNALLNIGFVVYKSTKLIVYEVVRYKWLKQLQQQELSTTVANIIGDCLFPGFFCILAALFPFALFQWYGYTQFCGLTKVNLNELFDKFVVDYAVNESLKLPSQVPSEWCSYFIPIPYSYIQSHYWNVGFLRYFHWKQIPNFVLASPMISLVLYFSWKFFCHHRPYCMTLGLVYSNTSNSSKQQTSAGNFDTYGARTLPRECFVYVAHAAFIGLFGLLCIHVQVVTRMMASSTPVIYWWLAVLTTPPQRKPQHVNPDHNSGLKTPRNEVIAQLESEENFNSSWKNLVFDERPMMPKIGVWLLNYFVGYACIGTIMFVNFLPWT